MVHIIDLPNLYAQPSRYSVHTAVAVTREILVYASKPCTSFRPPPFSPDNAHKGLSLNEIGGSDTTGALLSGKTRCDRDYVPRVLKFRALSVRTVGCKKFEYRVCIFFYH